MTNEDSNNQESKEETQFKVFASGWRDDRDFTRRIRELDRLSRKTVEREAEVKNWNKEKHEGEARLAITRLVLWWYFVLITFSFLFAAGYNFIASSLNTNIPQESIIPYLDIFNTVSLITSSLGSGVGFVIGYYFKNKGES